MKKNGFTFSELMMSLLIISVLAAILIPTVVNNKPNKNKVMFRKAYYITERVVSELINDEELYPDGSSHGDGFLNTYTTATDGTESSDSYKFCKNFVAKLNTSGTINCTNTASFSATPSFTTNDGIEWVISDKFGATSGSTTTKITVDVNGKAKEPNSTTTGKVDRFEISVEPTGKISVSGKGAEYLKSNTVN